LALLLLLLLLLQLGLMVLKCLRYQPQTGCGQAVARRLLLQSVLLLLLCVLGVLPQVMQQAGRVPQVKQLLQTQTLQLAAAMPQEHLLLLLAQAQVLPKMPQLQDPVGLP
jgi:hypothetical protein